jgi:hypothetical protein
MTFTREVCWDPSELQWIAPIDAAALHDDDAVFLGTHHPLRIIHRASSSSSEGELIDEHELLRQFEKPVGNDPHVVVISGAVGTGKSHLVKWLRAHAGPQPSWHQVYVEKRNTSLRRVVETILEGLTGPAIDDLREKLAAATTSITGLEEAKDQMLHELAHRLEFPDHEVDAESQYEPIAREELPHLLRDPVLRRHLLREDGAVHRITRLGIEGLSGDDDDSDPFINEEDLPLRPEDLADASGPATRAVNLLGRSDQLRSESVELLNRELASAKAAVFLGSGIDLIAVFDEVRQELARRGLELALYIEDLVLLHGIDRELAQVFTEGRGPDGNRCGMRVAIAVTEGYLSSGFDTLRSRAEHFSLDLRLGEDVSQESARSFVARYLNAARLGVARLRESADSGVDDDWPPNACNSCEYREPCHKAFGHDVNGWGYYPLNEVAVDRLVELVSRRQGLGGRFDPREVIRGAIRGPLDRASEELPRGEFPSGRFAANLDRNRTSVQVEVRFRLDDEPDGARRLALLGFWAPKPVTAVVNVHDGIHRAFELPPASNAQMAETRKDAPETKEKGATAGPQETKYEDVDAWANDERVLAAARARTVRQFVFDEMIETLRNGPNGRRIVGTARKYRIAGLPFDESCIQIEASAGGGAETVRPYEVRIARSARTAVLIKTILEVDAQDGWESEGAERYADFMALVDKWTGELISATRKQSKDLDPAVRLLALTSQPRLAEAETVADRLECLVQGPRSEENRTRSWSGFETEVIKARAKAIRLLEDEISSAKTTGTSSILDIAPALELLGKIGNVRSIPGKPRGSSTFVETQERLREAQSRAETDEWKKLDRQLSRIGDHLDGSHGWERLSESVAEVAETAHQAGYLAVATAREDLSEIADVVTPEALSIARRLQKIDEAKRSIWDLVPNPHPAVQALADYVDRAEEILQALEDRVTRDDAISDEPGGPGQLGIELRALADALDAAAGKGTV